MNAPDTLQTTFDSSVKSPVCFCNHLKGIFVVLLTFEFDLFSANQPETLREASRSDKHTSDYIFGTFIFSFLALSKIYSSYFN